MQMPGSVIYLYYSRHWYEGQPVEAAVKTRPEHSYEGCLYVSMSMLYGVLNLYDV